ncbi:RNA polymerase sigma factor [Tahibacter soli]|jgi:RNA polymerase sigma-70 factor (ECF subfamily)|uniref:Sigma-70 family RNA polymerase sigma factor n=1 Tax=Tahibacter soli TaxID=2983605 RepID=A0A9X3YTD7_9GAMM|nr:sigma-70 family RNA polymerase sigma factor [Tahibacter soli]MDC8016051.1 sigma-70 family RNA polymerase sigma factor [Tahibacter soli]
METALDAWFVTEILAHEAALVQFLRHAWPHADEVSDLRQEIYVRVYEAAGKSRPLQPKSFLFATARHLMTDRLRRGRIVSIEPAGDFDASNVLIDEVSPERRFGARQIVRRLADAFDRLPDRCRQIVWLRRVEELPQKEVAARLGITEKAVEKQIAKGMRLLADYYHDEAAPGGARATAKAAATMEAGRGHGRNDPD